jgi:hypothetical protein
MMFAKVAALRLAQATISSNSGQLQQLTLAAKNPNNSNVVATAYWGLRRSWKWETCVTQIIMPAVNMGNGELLQQEILTGANFGHSKVEKSKPWWLPITRQQQIMIILNSFLRQGSSKLW